MYTLNIGVKCTWRINIGSRFLAKKSLYIGSDTRKRDIVTAIAINGKPFCDPSNRVISDDLK